MFFGPRARATATATIHRIHARRAGEVHGMHRLSLPLMIGLLSSVGLGAQLQAGQSAAAQTPRQAAPIDITGNWVSVITEEWRWRMVTPPKGDFTSIPLSPAGKEASDRWEPSMDGSCRAYGAGGLMRMPTRLRIAWDGDVALRVDADAGQQTRRLSFDAVPAGTAPSLQGVSIAAWEPLGGQPNMRNGQRAGPAPAGGTLKVVTTNLQEGWMRRNGAAYSASASILEYWDTMRFPNGDVWLVVTQVISDPRYLLNDYTTSMHFKREADGSKWRPSSCRPA